MTKVLKIACQCGQVQGQLKGASPRRGLRMRCYCRSCQSYAHHLGQADAVLDANGGTELFQTTFGGLSFTAGQDQLACLRLGPKGPIRWYAKCCNTPIANTLAKPGLPFVALPAVTWQGDADAVLGTKTEGVWASHAVGSTKPAGAHQQVPPKLIFKVATNLLRGKLAGENRHRVFFDADGQPQVKPDILSREQREAADTARAKS